ncbi:MAG: hypothetical protein LBG88_02445 [Christensenellaceae bacterium]|jgi:hypothetical protein|nr:hypothetical protein [Christensenellaceae bacterium]
MGAIDKFLGFGNSRKGKIISWGIACGMATIFFIGITLTAVGSTVQPIHAFELRAAGMEWKTLSNFKSDYPGYHLNVSSINTPITALPTPTTTKNRTVFTTNSSLIEIRNPSVEPGGTAIITLKKINGMYEFSEPLEYDGAPETGIVINDDIDKIYVDARCGNVMRRVYIRIILRPEDVAVSATLESNIPGFPDAWLPADNVKMEHMRSESGPGRDEENPELGNPVQYRVRMTFSVFGEVIYDTKNDKDWTYKLEDNPNTFLRFENSELSDGWSSLVDLWNLDDLSDPVYYVFIRPNSITASEDYKFKVWCNFNGQEYFTETFFLINIKV